MNYKATISNKIRRKISITILLIYTTYCIILTQIGISLHVQGNSSLEATNEDITIQTKFPPAKSILDLINENINVEDKENLGNIGIYLSPNKKAPFQLMDSWNKQSKDFIYNRYQNYCRTLGKENVCPCLTEEHGNFGEFTAFCII